MRRLRSKISKKIIEGKVIFDAGTGVSSIEFLKSCNPKKIIAVTNSKNEIQEIKKQKLDKNIDIKFLLKDISDKKFTLSEKVDVIFAGYFFSALQGTKPFKTLSVMRNFRKFLKRDGIIIIEDFYWEQKFKKPQDVLVKKLWNLKDGLKMILGIKFPQQMPVDYLQELLEIAGYRINLSAKENEERINYDAKLKRYKENLQSIKKYINKFDDPKLKLALNKYADALMAKIEKIGKPAYFAHNYLIIASN
jgi:cyclopropane fatty-acyl-phospholipid synthase-like methyltransferase